MVQFCSATPERSHPPRRSIITPPFTRCRVGAVPYREPDRDVSPLGGLYSHPPGEVSETRRARNVGDVRPSDMEQSVPHRLVAELVWMKVEYEEEPERPLTVMALRQVPGIGGERRRRRSGLGLGYYVRRLLDHLECNRHLCSHYRRVNQVNDVGRRV